jgi:hypothetical protein
MAKLGGRGAEIQGSAVHLHAWDRGDHREIMLSVEKNLAALGLKARMKVDRFLSALQAVDPYMTEEATEENVNAADGPVAAGMRGTIEGFWTSGGRNGRATDGHGNLIDVKSNGVIEFQASDNTFYLLKDVVVVNVDGVPKVRHVDILGDLLQQLC